MVIALHLDDGTGKVYLCNQSGTASLFFTDLPATYCICYNSHSRIPTYTTQSGSRLSVTGEIGLSIVSSSLYSTSIIQFLRVNWGLNLLDYHMPVNISITTPWRICYL